MKAREFLLESATSIPAAVLIVDDDASFAKTLANALAKEGFEIFAAPTGQRALERVDERSPAVALIDLKLEDMPGFAVMEEIKQRRPHTECIVMTGHASQASAIEAINLGAYSYLQKPFEMEHLLVTIRRAVEKHDAEQALRKSNALLYRSQQIAHIGSWEWDLKTGAVALSDEMYRLFGVDKGAVGKDITVQTVLRLFHPDDVERITGTVRKMLDEQTISSIEFRSLWPDGTVRLARAEGDIVFDHDGRPVKMVGTMQDITEQRQAEAALRESEQRYRSLFENMQDGFAHCMMVYDDQNRPVDFIYLDVNDAFERLTGLKDVVGKPVTEVIPDIKEATPELFEIYGRVALTGQPEKFEIDFTPLARWLSISVYSAEKGHFVAVFDNITEQQQAEEALRRSERQWESTFNAMSDWVCLIDAETRQVVRTNRAGPEFLGSPLSEITGQTCCKLIHGSDELVAECPVPQMLRSGKRQALETRLPDGRYVSITVDPVRDEAGNITRAVHTVQDITKRKQTQEAESEQRAMAEALSDTASTLNSTLDLNSVLDRILENVERVVPHDAANIMLVDADHNHVRVVRRQGYAGRVTGDVAIPVQYAIDDLPNLRPMMASDKPVAIPDTRDSEDWFAMPVNRWVQSYAAAPIRMGEQLIGFLNLHSATPGFYTQADADRLSAFAAQAALAIQNAQLYQELETYSDFLEEAVGERTRELQRIKNRVETILNSVGDALFVIHPDGRIQQVNPAFEEQTGYKGNEVALQRYQDLLLSDEDRPAFLERAKAAIDAEQAWHGETAVRRKDGTTFDAAVTLSPLKSAGRKLVGFVVSLRDISPLKEVDRMKNAFVSNVSHELRTPITSLKLFLGLMETSPPEDHDELRAVLKRETDRLNTIIEDVLRLSRLDQGRIQMRRAPLDLNALAGQYVADRVPLAQSRGLSLSLDAAPVLPQVIADEGLIGQVLSILLTNAIAYTHEGGDIVVGTHTQQHGDMLWIGISVKDTGPGIPKKERPQLFQRFFRGHVGRESGAPGTGLGLAIAKEILDLHGGRIEVESDGISGNGSVFSIWLPAAAESSDGQGTP